MAGFGVSAKIVTLLFTDLVGSSALLERLGDEAGERTRRTHFGLLREAVAGAGVHALRCQQAEPVVEAQRLGR